MKIIGIALQRSVIFTASKAEKYWGKISRLN